MSGPARNRNEEDLSTVLRVRVEEDDGTTAGFELLVTEGPDAGTRFVLDGARPSAVLVGHGPACDLQLTDRQVSRRHAAFDVTHEGVRFVDLASKNGSYVQGTRVFDALLRGGETLTLGKTQLRLTPVGAPMAVATSPELRFGRLVGASRTMRRLYPLCERLAASDVPVIIEGETGTGKEVLAEALHEASPRAAKPFVVFDCTTVAPTLLESALFGHERGAFTGAVGTRRGVFELAHGGTLFVDEIGELDPTLQPKLLRAIERAEIQRVGSEKWMKVDVRVIAATRRDLDREVQEGRFRDDLFFRLAVGRIELPPLRRREGDIALLARHFWHELGGEDDFPDALIPQLEAYPWPGNVRELYNAISRRLALGDLAAVGTGRVTAPTPSSDDVDDVDDKAQSRDAIEDVLALDLPLSHARDRVVDAFERRYVARILERYGGSVARAAAASGIQRRYFQILKARHTKDP